MKCCPISLSYKPDSFSFYLPVLVNVVFLFSYLSSLSSAYHAPSGVFRGGPQEPAYRPDTRNFTFLDVPHALPSRPSTHFMLWTPSGMLRGSFEESVLRPDVKYVSFLGIPYARPPLHSNRFKSPMPAEPWSGVYDATSDANECLQLNNSNDEFQVVGSENCLYLNVFMPTPKPQMPGQNYEPLKPVIVYIHGGRFSNNAGTSELISPDYLIIEHDILLVTMNYRLHLFGFLNFDIPECNGNMGLRDQTMALKWVKQNIRSFGGDPNNVILMGQSAGAASTYLHILSPMSRGLFQKAIMHSPIKPLDISEEPELYSIKFAQHMGYAGNVGDRRAMFHYISSLDAEQLMRGYFTFTKIVKETDFKYYYSAQPFKPALDTYEIPSFLPKPLQELAMESPGIPIILGATNRDGALAFFQNTIEETIDYVFNHMEVYLDPCYTRDKHIEKEVIERVKHFYFKGEENFLTEAINLYTDLLYYDFDKYNAFLNASFHSNNIYNYQFCFDGSITFYKERYLGEQYYKLVRGAVHSEDLSYLFYSEKNYPDIELTDDDTKVIHNLRKWWTNFAKTGKPNSYADDINIEWKPISTQRNHLRIDKESCFVEERLNERRRQFWDDLSRQMKCA